MIPKQELSRICDRAKEELLALAATHETAAEPAPVVPEWLTAMQLAEHWQLRNSQGQVTTAGILKWAKRQTEDFPLPHAYMGDLIRFHRTEVDQWAREEADRRRVRKNKTHAQQTDPASDDKLRRTLTAVGY